MVDIRPFRGWRYDLAQVGDLSDVTCPPYDVIDTDFQNRLYAQHPYNVIRLELNRPEPEDATPEARYMRAASLWKHWKFDGVLRKDAEDTLYVYHQEFTWEGQTYVRKGFLACLRLEQLGQGQVFPHEQTLSGPKADRLALFQACRANLSPIFGLFPDETGNVQQRLDDACLPLTALQAQDPQGVIHRLWPVTDRSVIQTTREALRSAPVFIADGHHRYETGWNYRQELASKGQLRDEHAAANFVMMNFVGMQDPGLQILPTHRLVRGLPALTLTDLRHALDGHFEWELMGFGPQAARDTWEMVTADGTQSAFGFGLAADGGWLYARLIDDAPMQMLAANQSEEWRSLAVSRLHKLVLESLLPQRFPSAQPECTYVHRVEEVTEALAAESAQLGCLVPPATMLDIELVASHRETMPPKSTYFYPKLLTGMVFYDLND